MIYHSKFAWYLMKINISGVWQKRKWLTKDKRSQLGEKIKRVREYVKSINPGTKQTVMQEKQIGNKMWNNPENPLIDLKSNVFSQRDINHVTSTVYTAHVQHHQISFTHLITTNSGDPGGLSTSSQKKNTNKNKEKKRKKEDCVKTETKRKMNDAV